MKIRTGFVSNSSSSSFIIRKESFKEEDLKKIRNFFKEREGSYNTELLGEDELYIWGDLEAHNIDCNDFDEEDYEGPNDEETAHDLFYDMVTEMKILTPPEVKCFYSVYEDFATPKDLGDSVENWRGQHED